MTESTTLHKALIAIRKLKKQLAEKENFEPIAIIGLGCRFPEAKNKIEYWQLLSEGKNIITSMPNERWQLLEGTSEIDFRESHHPYWGGFLKNITDFDAYFFGISPREAIRMDPQQRIMLEVAYEAIEDAGLTIEALAGSNTGVFASLYSSQYGYMQEIESELDALFIPTGNALSIAANRLSYLFDLQGPSFVLDSACSSSLVSLHLACLNLQNKLCDLALVCGANINLLPSINLLLTQAKMLSKDGQCKTFDAKANGYVPGEGVGVVILKTLKNAIQDNDRVYAVIHGSFINQDGKTNGLTAPNGLQQEAILKSVYDKAKIDPSHISYVECHGTGTFLGDPIELQALGEVISKNRDENQPCWIGSVKTNIGHLEPAAGIASIIKVALSLKNLKIPPHLNFSTPNPHIGFDKYNLKIPLELQDWPKYGEHRVAGLSGFGFGGTNAHVVISEFSANEYDKPIIKELNRREIFTLSAKDPGALIDLVESWIFFLEKNKDLSAACICYNSHVRRSHYSYRLAIIIDTQKDLLDALLKVKKNTSSLGENIYINLDQKNKKNILLPEEMYSPEFSPKDLAILYVDGANINWKKYEENRSYPYIDMPLYVWQHKKYWPILINKIKSQNEFNNHPLQGKKISSPIEIIQFEFKFDANKLSELQDTYYVLHAGYYLEMLAFSINNIYNKIQFTIENLTFISALIVSKNSVSTVQLIINKSDSGIDFTFYSYNPSGWIENASGQIILETAISVELNSIESFQKSSTSNSSAKNIYDKIASMHMPAGMSIRWSKHYWIKENKILCQFEEPDNCKNPDNFKLKVHPGIIDGCIQPIFKLLPDENLNPYMASSIGQIKYFGMQKGPLYLMCHLEENSEEKIISNCYLLDEQNQLIAELNNITLTKLKNTVHIEQLQKTNEQRVRVDYASLSSQDRKQCSINFLTEQISIIFSMPQTDVDINVSLKDMGIDSLMALVLIRVLESEYKINYPVDNILNNATIMDIVNYILGHYDSELLVSSVDHPEQITSSNNNWISYRKKIAKAKLRLFCFPYGGSGASVYKEWQHSLPDSIEVCPIQLPGRENRMNETPIRNIDDLVEELIINMQNEFDLPFAFFGHSFGALIAFELTRSCRKFGLSVPEHLFISAFPDPRIPPKSLNNMLNELQSLNINLFEINNAENVINITDDELMQLSKVFASHGIVEYGDYLSNRNVIKYLLPIFIGDMSIVKSYQYHDEAPLAVPISIFLGKQDQWIPYNDHKGWNDHTNKKFNLYEFTGGHLFLKENQIRREILQIIINSLNIDTRIDAMQKV